MKICVFSDSHGYVNNMLRAIQNEQPDMIIHLGDGTSDLAVVARKYPDLPTECVRGNCDSFSTALMALNTTIAGKRFYAVHGHMFDVKVDPEIRRLKLTAMENDADIVLYGHTHMPYKDRSWAMEILNPGSCGEVPMPTYGIITIANSAIKTEIREIPYKMAFIPR